MRVTGVTMTPDHRTMLVNIQHPGDGGFGGDTSGPDNATQTSTWPGGASAARPRPASVVIQRKDGRVVGTWHPNVF